jgi:FkbM family methyltransferase
MQKDYTVNGKTLTICYEIERFINEVFVGWEYNKYLNLVGKDTQNDLTVMDIGCNIGTFSFSIYDRAKTIYAIDVSKECIDLLKKTIEKNALDKIIPIEQALAGTNGKKMVTSLTETDGSVKFAHEGQWVNTVTLYTLFEQYKIDYVDLLKIDVEGAEGEIFGSEDCLKLKGKIGAIIGEVHGIDIKESIEKLGLTYTKNTDHGNHFYAV